MTTTTETGMTDKPTLPPYQPMHVRLVGHRDLGVVRARWLGCLLELDDRTVYGPSALFEVRPVEEPKPKLRPTRPPLVWMVSATASSLCFPVAVNADSSPYDASPTSAYAYVAYGARESRSKCELPSHRAAVRQIAEWARADGYDVPPHPEGLDQPEPEPIAAPDPVLEERIRCLAAVHCVRPRAPSNDPVREAANVDLRHVLDRVARVIRDGSEPAPDDARDCRDDDIPF